MMDCSSEAEDQFFDSHDEITSLSDLGEDCCSDTGLVNYGSESIGYEFWTKNPESVHERRLRFLKLMGLSLDSNPIEREESGYTPCNEIKMGLDRVIENSGAVLSNSDLEEHLMSSESSLSSRSTEGTESLEDDTSEENYISKFENLDCGTEVQQLLRKEVEIRNTIDSKKKVKKGWLRKLNVIAHITDRQGNFSLKPNNINSDVGFKIHRVQVHPYRKRSKELSSLYAKQDFFAHEGAILTMKFSHDGQYLASAGEDCIVRVWKVTEDERPNNFDIQETDPSSLYFSVNSSSQLAPIDMDKDKNGKMKRLGNASESSCVIFPQKVFGILEKPLHEFYGHSDEVLALSWSKKGHLLSSSVDKTVRLWQVGKDQCLGVFSHNNYVTSIEFNPADDNYFISGSIDGKVRIWEVKRCQVVDWTDIREIVTAVCYYPDGKGGIVGSMDGSCRFYDTKDNHLQMEAQICLQGKKKLPSGRITCCQFSPSDPSKVMVTSADSQIRILCGANVICKFKSLRNSGSQVPAYFTSDGKHIVWASEDSNVSVWSYINQDKTSSKENKISSSESFSSHNASIALPWCGMKTVSESNSSTPACVEDDLLESILRNSKGDEDLHHKMPSNSSECFSLRRGFLLDSLPKGSATWPEEKLPTSNLVAVSPTICKSEYKVLKSAWFNTSNSHMWGLVIVTAGSDGRIRTFQNFGLPVHL